jgi:4-methyl-5(b-hydroxyethyl)-thiazole monophosphate biosynthesis
LKSLLLAQHDAGKWIAAVCASPAVVFATHGLLKDALSATCHPNFTAKLTVPASEDRVVVDKNIITSRGPGTSIEFALQCIACLDGKEKALEVSKPMVLHHIELK